MPWNNKLCMNPSQNLVVVTMDHLSSLDSSTQWWTYKLISQSHLIISCLLQRINHAIWTNATFTTFQVGRCVDTIFCLPSICVLDLKNSKNIKFLPWGYRNISIFMFLHQTLATWRFSSSLTKFDLRLSPSSSKNSNFDPTIGTSWD